MLVHLRVVPEFWVAAEERRRPALRAQPVVVGGLPHERGAVRAANLVAQENGIQAGMRLADASRLCPEGVFLTPDLSYYATVWSDLLEILARFTPVVEPLEMGQAVGDLGGCERRFPDIRATARAIAATIWWECGLLPWMGVAANRFTAQMAASRVDADGVGLVAPGAERAFLAGAPVTALPDVDDRLALLFQALGLRTIGALAALPAASVRQRFGTLGERLHALARGIDPRPVTPPPPRPAIAVRHVCDDGSLEEAMAALRTLAITCAGELEGRGLAGRVVELVLIWRREDHPRMGLLPPVRTLASPPAIPRDVLPNPDHAGEVEADTVAMPPVAARIHSMLPQPGPRLDRRAPVLSPARAPNHPPPPPAPPEREPRTHARAVARVPVSSAATVEERARSLLLRHWAREGRLHALELTVSEFERPTQLGFAELSRLDQAGALAGLSAERVHLLACQEEALTARYGDASFRHLEWLDPDHLLADRRFRWAPGLPVRATAVERRWPAATRRRGKRR